MNLVQLSYYDRHSGQVKQDPIYAAGFIDWLYNTATGLFLMDFILSRKWVSQLYGWLNKQRWSRRKIERFARRLEINLAEVPLPLDAFESFNDFMTRDIDLAKRPVNRDPEVCVAPSDGRVLVYPIVDADSSFVIKRATFNLRALLRDEELARTYSAGSLFVSRLYLTDYDHFHFSDDGVPRLTFSIPGKYFAVSPYSERRLLPFYGENNRIVTLFDSDHFGQVAMIEIGAFTIGSIQQCYQPGARVRKGDHKGFFQLGGSIVILLFAKGAIRFDEDLCKNTLSGMETYVRLGESIGRTSAHV